MHILFANTGVQIVCIPLRGRYASVQSGYGWQRCRCHGRRRDAANIPMSSGRSSRPAPPGCFWRSIRPAAIRRSAISARRDAGASDHEIRLEGCWTSRASRCGGVPAVELCIRPATATAGDAKHVHMVVDFGNSRTGALLLEMVGEIAQTPQMMPFELNNRYHMDAWNEEAEPVSYRGSRWFSSKTHWCNTPYLPPAAQQEDRVPHGRGRGRGGLVRPRQEEAKAEQGRSRRSRRRCSTTFDGPPGPRGRRLVQVMRAEGDIRTGLSSPKRYLWADDASWLEGANWYMADPGRPLPDGRSTPRRCAAASCKYVHEDDRDFLLEDDEPKENSTPPRPR